MQQEFNGPPLSLDRVVYKWLVLVVLHPMFADGLPSDSDELSADNFKGDWVDFDA